jgi:site-specific recombinase XerD
MKTHDSRNERIKRRYFTYLAEARGFNEATLDGIAKALNRFETYTKFRDFKAFHIEQAKGFKANLAEQTSIRTKDRLSKATLYATLSALKRFFIWLAGQPGYKSRISYSDAEYFNLSAKETRIAKAHREARVPTLEQIRRVISTLPATTEIERRDRALIAFTILTGARDGAIASLKLKHVDIDQGRVDQDARQVNTKFSKTFTTWFFPVGDDIRQVFVNWVTYLRQAPGRAMLATAPTATGSPMAAITMGTVLVPCLAARTPGVPCVTRMSTLRPSNSAAKSGSRSYSPSAQRNSMTMFFPST